MYWNEMIAYKVSTNMKSFGFFIDNEKISHQAYQERFRGKKLDLPETIEIRIGNSSKRTKRDIASLDIVFSYDDFLCSDRFLEILQKFQITFQMTKAIVKNSDDNNKIINKDFYYGRLLDRFPVLDRKYAEGWDENGNFTGSPAIGTMIIDEKKYLDACKYSDLFLIDESPAWVLASESFYKYLKKEKIFNLVLSPRYTYESWLVEYVERIRNNRIIDPYPRDLAEIKKRSELLERLYSSTERDWKKYLDELELP